MLTVRPSVPEDIPAQRELWKLAFGDSDSYIDNFYNTYYRPERVVVLEEGGAVRSMTAWFDTTFVVPGQGEYRAAYLYAVATHPDCRGQGLAGKLLAGADEYFRSLGIPAVPLSTTSSGPTASGNASGCWAPIWSGGSWSRFPFPRWGCSAPLRRRSTAGCGRSF